MDPLDAFTPAARRWFRQSFGAPTPVQAAGWQTIARGEHALLLAPTGSGKTLAAFFYAIDTLSKLPLDAPRGTRVLYISPLKALVTDIERNLRAPLIGVQRAQEHDAAAVRPVTVGMRTGDTPAKERQAALRAPPDILVTTPESLFLMLGSRAREGLKSVDTVIVDEIHALAPSKRGAHLALSLERLEMLCAQPFLRIGLSATVRPHREAAQFLAGARPVTIVDKSAKAKLSLRIDVPCEDMSRPPAPPAARAADTGGSILGALAKEAHAREAPPSGQAPGRELQGMWAAIYPRILELIGAHRSTIVFVNSRSLCERMAQTLNDLAGEPWLRAHHGSVSRRNRHDMEEALKMGTLRGIVATSSLELGIDMGSIDLVILVESPGSVARGLQRVGRAGHAVGETSVGICFPKHTGDLLEAVVVAKRMHDAELEPICVPKNPLDVLAQQIVAHCATSATTVGALEAMVTRAYPYQQLSKPALLGVIDMLSGAYPSDEFAELRPLLRHDRQHDLVEGRASARMVATLNGGTIVDRGLFGVFLAGDGPRVGELDEEMVHESRKGDVFMLGASSWRIEEITRDQVRVTPAPGQPGKMPFWRGEGPGRPVSLGQAVGAMCRDIAERSAADALALAAQDFGCEPFAAQNLVRHVHAQQAANGAVPSDRAITIERFRDEVGDWRICILSPLGAPVHAPWAMLLEVALSQRLGQPIDALYTNDGIALRISAECLDSDGFARTRDGDAAGRTPLSAEWLLPDADDLSAALTDILGKTALFASHFRENATRALLLTRKAARGRAPLWQQRLRAKTLLSAAERYASFPIVLETYRQLLRDVFDVPALQQLLHAIAERRVRVDMVQSESPSPFARALAFAYVQTYLYELDAPSAERHAQALTLDREMLRELLGEEDLRQLLEPAAIDEVEASLQGMTAGHGARDADGVADLLRRLGDLSADEVAVRLGLPRDAAQTATAPLDLATGWLGALVQARRAAAITLSGERRFIALEDVARYRDGLGIIPPAGVPSRFLVAATDPVESLMTRFARTHGPFSPQAVAQRFGLSGAYAEALCAQLAQEQRWQRGAIDPRHGDEVYCHPDVLRRLKRATLSRVRQRIAALEPRAYARLLPGWQSLDAPRRGHDALLGIVRQLAGLPLPFTALINDILPARVRDFTVDQLDMLCASGAVAWVGAGALGTRDGRVRVFAREQLPALVGPVELPVPSDDPLHGEIVALLTARGPSFFVALQQAVGASGRLGKLEAALWDLVWAGLVTNDTVAPLQKFCAPPARRSRTQSGHAGTGGRWSLVAQQIAGLEVAPTAHLHARAHALLHRWGIVSRDTMGPEQVSGGFSALYPIFKAMEEAGRVRRGLFVEGLSAAQFGLPAAIERLRAGYEASLGREPTPMWLSCVDPAQPYGAVLPWPPLCADGQRRRLRRVAGAKVLLVDGAPWAFLEAGGHGLWLFAAASEADADALLVSSLQALAAAMPTRTVVLQHIDGQPALRHARGAQFLQAGMVARFDGLAIGVPTAGGG